MQLFNSLIFMLGEMSPYILLGFLIAGLMHAFIPQQSMAKHLAGHGWKAAFKAALLGVPLPLCSCGVLPTAIGMRRTGASKASATSFLIATPQTGVDSIAATWSLLGPAFAVIRPIAAFVTAIFGGVAVGRGEKAEKSDDSCNNRCDISADNKPVTFIQKTVAALRYGFIDLVASIGSWLVIGLIIAAFITVYVPDDVFTIFGKTPLLSMLIVLIIAIPMYVCATGSIPIALSLMLKGLSPGTALVLLMAGPAANFASFTIISREMGKRAAVTYLISIIAGAVAFGLAIDYLMPASWFAIGSQQVHAMHSPHLSPLAIACSTLLVALLLYTFIKRFTHKQINTTEMTTEYIIKGMNCPHCQAAVAKAISAVDGVTAVDVNLSSGKAVVEGTHSAQSLTDAVRAAGFDVEA